MGVIGVEIDAEQRHEIVAHRCLVLSVGNIQETAQQQVGTVAEGVGLALGAAVEEGGSEQAFVGIVGQTGVEGPAAAELLHTVLLAFADGIDAHAAPAVGIAGALSAHLYLVHRHR